MSEPIPACSSCGADALLRCSRCLGAFYCDAACQRAHWAAHKQPCAAAERVRATAGGGSVDAFDAKFAEHKRRAARGDAEAMFQVGLAFDFGVGVARDKAASAAWFRRAAAAGHPQAAAAAFMSAAATQMFGVPK